MATQNINNFYFNRFDAFLSDDSYTDFFLVADEKQYDQEVVFSTKLIGYDDGNKLPINIELSNTGSTQIVDINYGDYLSGNTLVSLNNYNPNLLDNVCYSAYTGACDAGLTGIDVGMFTEMTGQTLYYSMGINDTNKFHPHYYDRRFKMRPVTGYTQSPNTRFSGITAQTLYNMVSKTGDTIGQYFELYGGYFQGFYKLFGYDYEALPERPNKGWTAEFLLRPRLGEEFNPSSGQTYLNNVYPDNSGTFFFMGARAENKFYHYPSGYTSAYTNTVTSELTGCLGTCRCGDTAVTNSDCYTIYPLSAITISKNCSTETVVQTQKDPEYDMYSNALSVRFSGDPANPRLCAKFLLLTGNCVTTGTCENTGKTYETGYTITEICSTDGIYDICNNIGPEIEKWVLVDVVFSRYQTYEDCDVLNMGGLGDVRKMIYTASTYHNTISLLGPPSTHSGNTPPQKVEVIQLNRKWLDQKNDRLGVLKFFVNGRHFISIENFEEIIPRELNDVKEKQIGVPFNISLGGGSFGLRESLTFSGCSGATGPYVQDPEVMSDNTLSGTSLSGLTTPILIEQNFGGTFMGAVSQFRFYVEPLVSSQVQHNYRILKDDYELFNYDCPDTACLVTPSPTPTPSITPTNTPTPSTTPTNTPTPSVTPSATPSVTPTNTPTPSITPSITPSTSSSITPNLYYDAGNTSSYSGAGTTLYNIGSDGLASGTEGTLSGVVYESGIAGGVFNFDGGSDRITFPSYDFGDQITVTAWVYPRNEPSINTLLANAAANSFTDGFKLHWNSWNTTNYRILVEAGNGGTGGAYATTNTNVVVPNQWQQLTYVIDFTNLTISLYRNGTLLSGTGSLVANVNTSATWNIGSMMGSYYMDANLGELKVFKSLLSSTDITNEYNNSKTRYGL